MTNDRTNPPASPVPPPALGPTARNYHELWMRTGLARGTRMLWRGRPLKDYSPAVLVAIIGMLMPDEVRHRPEATVRSLTWVICYLASTVACNRRRVAETDNLTQALVALRAARDRETQLSSLAEDALVAAYNLSRGVPEADLGVSVDYLRDRGEQLGVVTEDTFAEDAEDAEQDPPRGV